MTRESYAYACLIALGILHTAYEQASRAGKRRIRRIQRRVQEALSEGLQKGNNAESISG